MLCSFPDRRDDARGQAETRDKIGFAASSIDTATWAQQNERGFAASPIDTATRTSRNSRRDCDVSAAKRTRFCSFPHRHGDARGQAETRDEIGFTASAIDTATWAQRGFAASPIDTELTTRKRRDDQLEANRGPAPRPPDYKREPFATHSGKRVSRMQYSKNPRINENLVQKCNLPLKACSCHWKKWVFIWRLWTASTV